MALSSDEGVREERERAEVVDCQVVVDWTGLVVVVVVGTGVIWLASG